MNITYISLTREEIEEIAQRAADKAIKSAARETGELWGPRDVARYLEVSTRTVTNYIKQCKLPMPVAGKWRKAEIMELWGSSP